MFWTKTFLLVSGNVFEHGIFRLVTLDMKSDAKE